MFVYLWKSKRKKQLPDDTCIVDSRVVEILIFSKVSSI